jgi:hypothetical protein
VSATYCKFTVVKINTESNTFPILPYHVFELNVYIMILSHVRSFLFVHV